VSGQFHASAALPTKKESPVPNEQEEAGWASEPGCMPWRREILPPLPGIEPPSPSPSHYTDWATPGPYSVRVITYIISENYIHMAQSWYSCTSRYTGWPVSASLLYPSSGLFNNCPRLLKEFFWIFVFHPTTMI